MTIRDRVIHHPLVWKVGDALQKRSYRAFTRRFGADDVLFLNYGYEEDPPMALPLTTPDEPDRFSIQLYHRTATQADDLSGKKVLEVGCGHGGGASYLTRTLKPTTYTGLDLNPDAITFNRQRHNVPGLEFTEGDAENLPFGDQTFDAVINVESSIHYPHFRRFLGEVARVLRPGGHFLYTDGRFRAHIADWEAALADAPMRMLAQRGINAEVVRGMERNSPRWEDVIGGHRFSRAGCQCVQGSMIHRKLQSGKFSYRMYCFTKE